MLGLTVQTALRTRIDAQTENDLDVSDREEAGIVELRSGGELRGTFL